MIDIHKKIIADENSNPLGIIASYSGKYSNDMIEEFYHDNNEDRKSVV